MSYIPKLRLCLCYKLNLYGTFLFKSMELQFLDILKSEKESDLNGKNHMFLKQQSKISIIFYIHIKMAHTNLTSIVTKSINRMR